MDYDLYHDESKVDGYWHGILLVPRNTRKQLLSSILEVRDNFGFQDPITFKGLKAKGKKYFLIQSWLSIAAVSLIQFRKNQIMPYYSGKIIFNSSRRSVETKEFISIVGCKFILLRIEDDHKNFNNSWYSDYASKIETSLRIALKGGLHFLGDNENKITIKSLHLDGHEHYQRNVDIDRIIMRLSGLKEYCTICENVFIDDRTGNHIKENCQEYSDCQLLQLTDLLIGAFRTQLGSSTNIIQTEVSKQVKKLVEKWYAGPARMKNSRWNRGIALSQAQIEKGKWKFSNFVKKTAKDNFELFD